MIKKEFLKEIINFQIECKTVDEVETLYKCVLPDDIKKLLSYKKEGTFVENWRILCTKEILNADEELHVPFIKKRILPLIDIFDNDFIVYLIEEKQYAIMNIIDCCVFDRKQELGDYLEE